MSAFGIRAGEAFLIDSRLLRTGYDLAILWTVFRHAPFVLVGSDSEDPIVKSVEAINANVKASERIAVARDLESANALLHKKIAEQLRRLGGASTGAFTQKRILLSSRSPFDASALKKQLGDEVLVTSMTLEKFSEIALGIVNRFGLASLAEQLQRQVLNQFLISKSA
jgi:hypothetical protein